MSVHTIIIRSKGKAPLNSLFDDLIDFDHHLEDNQELQLRTEKSTVMADGEPLIIEFRASLEISDEDSLTRYKQLIDFLVNVAPLSDEGFEVDYDQPPSQL